MAVETQADFHQRVDLIDFRRKSFSFDAVVVAAELGMSPTLAALFVVAAAENEMGSAHAPPAAVAAEVEMGSIHAVPAAAVDEHEVEMD